MKFSEPAKYTVTISPTAQGDATYLQIMSSDLTSVNVVLIGEFEIRDTRGPIKPPPPAKKRGRK